jgi:hypothetical protein
MATNTDPVLLRGFINGLQVALPGFFGRTWQLFRRNHYNDGHTALSSSLASGRVYRAKARSPTPATAQFETSGRHRRQLLQLRRTLLAKRHWIRLQIDLSGPMIFYNTVLHSDQRRRCRMQG